MIRLAVATSPCRDRRSREERMETVIARLLRAFETGKVTRRQLIQSLAAMASAATAAASAEPVAAAGGFKTVSLDHISLEVADYKRTRDFYADVMGMRVENDSARLLQCELHFGDSMIDYETRIGICWMPLLPYPSRFHSARSG